MMLHPSIIITFPYSLGLPGGGPRDYLQTVKHLALKGARVTVMPVATHVHKAYPRPALPDEASGKRQYAELIEAGVSVKVIAPSPVHYLLDAWRVRNAVKRAIDGGGVDAVISYWLEGMFLPAVLRRHRTVYAVAAAASYSLWLDDDTSARRSGPVTFSAAGIRNAIKRYVYWPLIDHVYLPVRRLKSQWFFGRSLRAAEIVFARSEFTGRELIKYFQTDPARIRTTYCGVDGEFSSVPRLRRDTVSRFIYFGAFVRAKGVFDAIAAFGRLAEAGLEHWTLRIAGWGDVAAVVHAAEQAGIADRIEHAGRLDRAALLDALAWADVAVLPSHGESFGLAIAEAQASGLPVIACHVGAVPEVVEDNRTGWLVDKGRPEQLYDRLRRAIEDPALTYDMGMRGRDRIYRNFSWEASADAMLTAIERAGRSKLPIPTSPG